MPKSKAPPGLPVENLYLMTQEELYDYVLSIVKDKFQVFTGSRQMYIACFPLKGSVPYPVLGAHLDIKHKIPPLRVAEKISLEDGRRYHVAYNIEDEPCILGADDRNGVWTMLQLIQQGFTNWGYIFTQDEELGRLGAIALRQDGYLQKRAANIAYYLMLDSPGLYEIGFRELKNTGIPSYHHNRQFKQKLYRFESWDVKKNGSTDYLEYCAATGLCGVNLASGYFDHHKDTERSDIEYLQELPAMVVRLVDHLGYKQYPLEYELHISA